MSLLLLVWDGSQNLLNMLNNQWNCDIILGSSWNYNVGVLLCRQTKFFVCLNSWSRDVPKYLKAKTSVLKKNLLVWRALSTDAKHCQVVVPVPWYHARLNILHMNRQREIFNSYPAVLNEYQDRHQQTISGQTSLESFDRRRLEFP